MCSSGSICTFAAKRARESSRADALAELRLGQQQEVVVAARQTTSGAITRAFAVSSSASQEPPAGSDGDVVRDHALEVVGRVRPAQRDVRTRPASDA